MAKKKVSKDGPVVYGGRGILFTVFESSKNFFPGNRSTITVLANAIDEALDQGHETSDDIARYLVTNAFQHVTDRAARYNNLLHAGGAVGANVVQKLHNGWHDLLKFARDAETEEDAELFYAEARGFAEAVIIAESPFSTEDPDKRNHINWDEVEHLVELMEDQNGV